MSRLRLTTYQDLIEHVVDYAGGDSREETSRFARRAVQDAYNVLPSIHNWSYLYLRGRITTSFPQTLGSVTYTNSTRTVTLTGNTWPSWTAFGSIVINAISYPVESVTSSTTLTLTTNAHPGADVDSTSYTLYQDTYVLPIDFIDCDELIIQNYGIRLTFEHPAQWLIMQRIFRGPATPRVYTIIGSPSYMGAMCARFFPPPDNSYQIDYIYKRRPRQINNVLTTLGTVSLSSNSATVTGNGTSFDSNHIGAVIRFSDPGVNVTPTGPGGQNPAKIERMITSVASDVSLGIDAVPGVTESSISYAISDPIDLEEGAMLPFFLRLCERQYRRLRRVRPEVGEEEAYQEALQTALEADNRSFQRQGVGMAGYPRRLRDFPTGPDVGVT